MPVDLYQKLSPNFALWEFTKSPTADRHGIRNIPNKTEIRNLTLLCSAILQPARDALGPLKISSGFRSKELNDLVGGVPDSDHRVGFAADVIPVDAGTREFAEWVVHNCQNFDQVILEFGTLLAPSWIHVSIAPRLRHDVLRAYWRNGKTVYRTVIL